MADLRITRSGELEVAGIQGASEAGVEFVDAFFLPNMEELYVVDSGRIVIPSKRLDALVASAKAENLTVDVVEGL